MIEDDLDIFICTHKDFNAPVSSKVSKTIDSRKIATNLPMDDKFYSELYQMKYVYDNIPLKKYVGFCQYRKYFSFLDDIQNVDKIFETNGCIISSLIDLGVDIRRHYATVGNVEDLFIIESIVLNKYPDYYDAVHTYFDRTQLIPGNMFIMKAEDFRRYCEFVFGVLEEYLNIVGVDIKQRILDRKGLYLKNYYPNNTFEYQYRIGGQMAERLIGAFIIKNFKNVCCVGLKITENKYDGIDEIRDN